MEAASWQGHEGLRSANKVCTMIDALALEDQDYSVPEGIGFLSDERMLSHECIWVPSFPEMPSRLKAALDRIHEYGLLDRCVIVPSRMATETEILRCHSNELLEQIRASASMTENQLEELSTTYDGVYFHPRTFEAAMLAAGCAVEAVDKVVNGELRHSMALVRPPGHHAMYNEPNGYCVFNNAAVAVRHALDVLGFDRVLVVDWDVHHGQGLQYAFYDDPRVLYFSVHRYEYGTFWPNLRQSDYDFIGGRGKGRGYNINMPLNKVGLTNGDFMAILQQVLMPVAHEFSPQLVLVCCGFDASIGDAEGRSEVTPAAYAHFTHMMKQLADGKLVLLIEGGYCLKSFAEGVALTLRCLLGEPCPDIGPLHAPVDETVESILQVIRVLRPFWHCFAYQETAANDTELPAFFKNIEIPKSGVEFATEENRPAKFPLEEFEVCTEDEARLWNQQIDTLIAKTKLFSPPNRTCVAYDDEMMKHTAKFPHVESPQRIGRIFAKFKESGLLDRCKLLPSRLATKDELCLVHSCEYVNEVEAYELQSDDELADAEHDFISIYLCQASYRAALLSAGCALNVADEILSGQSRNGFAVVRPPGHHAEQNFPMGFCIFNNVCILAKYAQTKYHVNRILILDWDVHHGNGVQNCFDGDPSVLYISIHRGDIFPAGDLSCVHRVGVGQGVGFNINIPWTKGGMGDSEYLAAFQQIVMPVAYEFGPELVLVSAGFDAALGDPLGGCRVSPVGYAHMTHMLSSLAAGKLILVLEGGYNLSSISDSAEACLSVMLGDRIPALSTPKPPHKRAVQTINVVLDQHELYWKSLAYRVKMPSRNDTLCWLGDDVTKLSVKVSDILKLDVCQDSFASPAVAASGPQSSDSKAQENVVTHPEAIFSDSFSPASKQDDGLSSASEAQGLTADVDAVTDAVGRLTVVAAAADTDVSEPCISSSSAVAAVASAAAAEPAEDEDAAVAEAVGGQSNNNLFSMLAPFADDTESLELFAVEPLPFCPHLTEIQPLPVSGLRCHAPCQQCGAVGENWVCLTCFETYCSRYVHGHMKQHGTETGHAMVLSYADISVWCYECDSYVHHPLVLPAKQAAYLDKFNEQMPMPHND